MNELLTTYTIKTRNQNVMFEFQYDLNGFLRSFKLLDDGLNEVQQKWLFQFKVFPYYEKALQSWENSKKFEVIKGEPDLSFESFWKRYNYKVGGRAKVQKEWKKLSKTEQLNAIKNIKAYEGFLKRKQIAKLYPERYLKHKRFNDQFNSY